MIYGKSLDGWWTYIVPEQTGSVAMVDWTTRKPWNSWPGRQWVGRFTFIRVMGRTVRTDISTWEEPEHSGIHVVLGRGGSYTVSVSVGGCVFPYRKGSCREGCTVRWETSGAGS